ncbi:MAG: 3-hydroxyacyl-CoA dehydrogenase NAD-binding domain-containing protein, partial [Pseudobdellovibrionaceae bacterium]
MKIIGIIGAGQMGNGIAQVAAAKNLKVIMSDIQQGSLDKGLATIVSSCDRLIKKEAMTAEAKTKLLSQITTTTRLADLKDCDVVIEAATENVELKLKVFKELDEVVQPKALLLSNTSSISITKIAAVTKRPSQVAGMHFMNPVPLMKLVEGIRGIQTSDETFQQVRSLAESLDKVFVESVKDMPGFI